LEEWNDGKMEYWNLSEIKIIKIPIIHYSKKA